MKKKKKPVADGFQITEEEWNSMRGTVRHTQDMVSEILDAELASQRNFARLLMRMDAKDGKPIDPELLRLANPLATRLKK